MSRITDEMNLEELLEDIRYLIKKEQTNFALNIMADLHPADIAEVMTHLDGDERRAIFNQLPADMTPQVLVELEENVKEDVLEGVDNRKLARMISEMDSDDATDILSELPVEQATQILKSVEEESSEDIQELLLYPEDSAGGIMAKEYVVVNANQSVSEAVDEIRSKYMDVENLYYCFVTDKFNTLLGMISLRDLILAKREERISDIMNQEVVTIDVDMDQEEVARLFKKYDLVVAPVVNRRHKLVGRITIDDVVDVIGEEMGEDLGRIAGTGEEEVLEDSVFQISRARLPWLVLSFVGQIIAALIMKSFEATIQQIIASTFFIPMVMAMGGSVGQQSSIIAVRGLVTGEIGFSDLGRRLKRELYVALLNGAFLAMLIFLVIAVWIQDYPFGAMLGTSLVAIILTASLFGAVIPLMFKKFNIDPALATGPFVAAFNDVVGLLIYFSLLSVGFQYFI